MMNNFSPFSNFPENIDGVNKNNNLEDYLDELMKDNNKSKTKNQKKKP